MARVPKPLGRGLINNAAVTTLYTVPAAAGSYAVITYFSICNNAGADKTVSVWLGAETNANLIAKSIDVRANRTVHLAGGNNGTPVVGAGITILAKCGEDATSLSARVDGAENDAT